MNFITYLPTARESNVFTGVCHSVNNRPHGYLVTAHPCYSVVGTHPTEMLSCWVLLLLNFRPTYLVGDHSTGSSRLFCK